MTILADLRTALERAVAELAGADVAEAIGALAAAQARLLAQLTTPAPVAAPDDVVDVATLSAELGLAASWLRAQARGNKLPHLRCGKYIKFRRAEVLAALSRSGAEHRMGAPVNAEKPSNGAAAFPLVSKSAPEPRHG